MLKQWRITTQVGLVNTLKFFLTKSKFVIELFIIIWVIILYGRGVIAGAKVSQYLLERSRIVFQAPGERNYHVFYEMLAGLPKAELSKYGLGSVEDYFYLNQVSVHCVLKVTA